MDLRTQQDLEYFECEKLDRERMEKRDKERMEEFYKSMFAEPKEEEPIQLTKEELRIARLRFFEKKIDLKK
jgi:hypothetical protein